jgi:hypothetical protein
MPMMNAVAEWARQHPKTWDLWRGAGARRAEVTRADRSPAGADDLRPRDARAVPASTEPLGAQGGLSRTLVALMRQPFEAPRDRARVRASGDRLVETIRALSSF